jgi:hypothetical protein
LDVAATVEAMRVGAGRELADGALDLVMIPVAPAVTDATPLVAQANALLTGPFNVDAYDPIRDEWFHWTAPPETWAAWLTAAPAPAAARLTLAMNSESPARLRQQQLRTSGTRHRTVAAMQNATPHRQRHDPRWHHPTPTPCRPGRRSLPSPKKSASRIPTSRRRTRR